MNNSNLKSIGARTTSEQREITRKGGQKSGEVRRRNRDIKKIVAAMLQGPPDQHTAERLRAQGIDERDITNKAALALSLYDAAMAGNVKAFEALMKYSGEDPDQQRKDAELDMKRDLHVLLLSDKEKDYSGLDVASAFISDYEKKAVLISVQGKYKELTDARKLYESPSYDDEYYDDDDEAETEE